MLTFNQFSDFMESLRPGIQARIRKYIGQVTVDYKADNSPVTLADREIEAFIIERIEKYFPESVIVGEESGTHGEAGRGKVEWVIDPIDGTKSFIHGVPLFATLIGVMLDGKAVYGAIYNPLLDDLVIGDNQVALWNGKPTKVRECKSLDKALVLTTDTADIAKHRNVGNFNDLAEQAWLVRTWGDAYGYFLLATGRGDVMVDPIMSRWDLAALIPVVRGAAGVITDYYGGGPETADSIVAAGPDLHGEVIKMLNR